MTSFTRKLYSKDPGAARAAEDFARQTKFERAQDVSLRYGKHPTLACFHSDRALIERSFGRRVAPPVPHKACSALCQHPACSQGCTLAGRRP